MTPRRQEVTPSKIKNSLQPKMIKHKGLGVTLAVITILHKKKKTLTKMKNVHHKPRQDLHKNSRRS